MMSDRWSGFASCSSAHQQPCQWQMLQQQIKQKQALLRTCASKIAGQTDTTYLIEEAKLHIQTAATTRSAV